MVESRFVVGISAGLVALTRLAFHRLTDKAEVR